MQIKRFEGKEIKEVLKEVKETLGPEAIILSTKTVKKPSDRPPWGTRSYVEVIAAVDRPYEPPSGDPIAPSSARPGEEKIVANPREAQGKHLLRSVLAAGLMPEFAQSLVGELENLRQGASASEWSDLGWSRLRLRLMEAIEVTEPFRKGQRIWAFIGPTGVGKTTTLVKLAAQFWLHVTKRITLITIDTYRIGAVEQLKTYGQILRLPVEVASSPEELRDLIDRHRGQDLLLIDTAGRNPRQASRMKELGAFLSVHPSIENHLVLSATMKERDLARMTTCFSIRPISSYIFTKIDETEEYVPLFNQLLRFPRPLSYLTCGQRVPEDIELATKARVSDLVLSSIQWN